MFCAPLEQLDSPAHREAMGGGDRTERERDPHGHSRPATTAWEPLLNGSPHRKVPLKLLPQFATLGTSTFLSAGFVCSHANNSPRLRKAPGHPLLLGSSLDLSLSWALNTPSGSGLPSPSPILQACLCAQHKIAYKRCSVCICWLIVMEIG